MSRYQFELATMADDAQLRSVLAETPMQGRISVSFRREPSYFAAAAVHGPFFQTVACKEQASGQIIGYGVRSVRSMYVNGTPHEIGYLSELRVRPEHRNLGLVARGYAYFRQLHGDGRTPLYLTTIAEGNARAIAVLTSGRAGLPPYHFGGRWITAALPTSRSSRPKSANSTNGSSSVHVRCADRDELPELLAFWRKQGSRRQFFPCFSAADFFSPAATFHQLDAEDLLLAFRNGRLIGTLGVWNQTPFRQSIVERYSAGLRLVRPAHNAWASWRGRPRLPAVGKPFAYRMAALAVVEGEDTQAFAALLSRALTITASQGPAYLMVGMHESDPLRSVVAGFRRTEYVTRLYLVCWEDGDPLRKAIDDRTPYLELGTL